MTTNLINNKKYIGQHKSSEFTENYKGSGTALWNAINKYGWDNFKVEMIEECQSLEELNNREAYWTKFYNAVESDEFYNLVEGGNQPGFSDELRIKLRKNHVDFSGSNNPMYGRHHSEETRKKMRISGRGKHSVIAGSNHPFYGKFGKDNPNYGKKRTNETKRRMSEAYDYNKHNSEETRKRMSASAKKRTGKIFINNSERCIMIYPEEFDYYSSIGYVKGKLRRR